MFEAAVVPQAVCSKAGATRALPVITACYVPPVCGTCDTNLCYVMLFLQTCQFLQAERLARPTLGLCTCTQLPLVDLANGIHAHNANVAQLVTLFAKTATPKRVYNKCAVGEMQHPLCQTLRSDDLITQAHMT